MAKQSSKKKPAVTKAEKVEEVESTKEVLNEGTGPVSTENEPITNDLQEVTQEVTEEVVAPEEKSNIADEKELKEKIKEAQDAEDASAASKFFEEMNLRSSKGELTKEDLELLEVEQIKEYATFYGYRFNVASEKPELIEQVLEKMPPFDHIGGVKDIRKEIDGTILFVKKLPVEDLKTAEHLFYSKCWLGKLLEFLGADNPYTVNKKIQNASEIPPTADTASADELNNDLYQFGLLSHLNGVLILRDEAQSIIEKIDCIDLSGVPKEKGRYAAICKTQAWVFACQAKFELGNTLSKIRNK